MHLVIVGHHLGGRCALHHVVVGHDIAAAFDERAAALALIGPDAYHGFHHVANDGRKVSTFHINALDVRLKLAELDVALALHLINQLFQPFCAFLVLLLQAGDAVAQQRALRLQCIAHALDFLLIIRNGALQLALQLLRNLIVIIESESDSYQQNNPDA